MQMQVAVTITVLAALITAAMMIMLGQFVTPDEMPNVAPADGEESSETRGETA